MHRDTPHLPSEPSTPTSERDALTTDRQRQETVSGRQNNLTVTFPDERGGELCLSFKSPAREALVASANRLLRFEFPILRDSKTYERLIKTNVISTGLSKKKLESLPLPDYETIYRKLWEQALGPSEPIADKLLNLFLLIEELSEFIPEHLMKEDIQLLGLRDPGKVPRFYYEDNLNQEQLAQFLSLHGYKNDFLTQSETIASLSLHYLACRRLSQPIPWTTLLNSLNPVEVQKFHRLHRLKEIERAFQQEIWHQQALQSDISASTLNALIKNIETFLHSEVMKTIASQCGISAPVKTLVLVEGETERLLLPLFAKAAGYDFCALGIEVWPAGGKNYMPTLYRNVSQQLKAGIFIVLDRDAESIAHEIQPILRPTDALFQIQEGEFEDIYDLSWILQIINRVYQPYPELTLDSFQAFSTEFQSDSSGLQSQRVQTLKAIWQAHNLGSFDKIAFAQQYADMFAQMPTPRLPQSMNHLLKAIINLQPGTE